MLTAIAVPAEVPLSIAPVTRRNASGFAGFLSCGGAFALLQATLDPLGACGERLRLRPWGEGHLRPRD
jgi:hypothetical protein